MTEREKVEFGCDAETLRVEPAGKLRVLQEWMAGEGFAGVAVSRHENLAWLTAGAVDVRVGLLRETGPASVLVLADGWVYYVTTNNEAARLGEEEFAGLGYEAEVLPWFANDVAGAVARLAGGGRVAADAPLGGCEVVSLQGLRLGLVESERARYRWVGRVAAEACTEVLRGVRPGMTEREMQGRVGERLMAAGLLPSVYLEAVDGRIGRYRHAVPRGGVLERFGMVGFCVRGWGLTVAMTRFVHFGAMEAELEERFRAVAEVNARLMAATRVGVSAEALFGVAREGYAAVGFAGEEEMHHQGGATGYMEREWVARPGGGQRVLGRQAFAWNPNLRGAKVEDTVVLWDGAVELLTGTPGLPVVQTECGGEVYRTAGVLVG